ncbi:hypothetical protein [Aneurinibacillus migulanus]|nr:hypothetical protein [Aneurinibacillus migulanus]
MPDDWSAVVRVAYGDTAFLFTGDAKEQLEKDMIATGQQLRANVLKVGHPASGTIGKLQAKNIKTYRTDLHGTVVATSNGKTITFKTTKTTK